MRLFYADYGMMGSQEPEWLQGIANVLTSLFQWSGLVANVSNSKAITFQTEEIWYGMLEEEVD